MHAYAVADKFGREEISFQKLTKEKYCRDDQGMPLHEAIRKMTSYPAQLIGLNQRGLLRDGMKADIVVFDPVNVIDKATYSNPSAPSTGFQYVIVGGIPLVFDGILKDNLFPGKAARAPIVLT